MTSSFDHNPHASAPYSQHHFERQPPFGAVRNTSEYNKIYRSSTAQLTAIANATVAGQKWIHPTLSNVLINPSNNLSVSDICGPTYIKRTTSGGNYMFPSASLLVPALLEKYKCYKITPGYSYPIVFVVPSVSVSITLNNIQSLSDQPVVFTLNAKLDPYILQILITSTTPGSESYKVIVPNA